MGLFSGFRRAPHKERHEIAEELCPGIRRQAGYFNLTQIKELQNVPEGFVVHNSEKFPSAPRVELEPLIDKLRKPNEEGRLIPRPVADFLIRKGLVRMESLHPEHPLRPLKKLALTLDGEKFLQQVNDAFEAQGKNKGK